MSYIQNKLDEFIETYRKENYSEYDVRMVSERLATDYHNHIVEKVKNWFDSELENNKGDIKTYRNIHQDKEGILSLLQDTNPKE